MMHLHTCDFFCTFVAKSLNLYGHENLQTSTEYAAVAYS